MKHQLAADTLSDDRYYRPPDDAEARAKFAYFQEAENKINGGPAPVYEIWECGTNAGYMRHYRLDEERCGPCKAAHAEFESKRDRTRNPQSGNNNCRPMISEAPAKQNRISGTG